jgi:Cof subfamily protein (haloacid dehalogenase superfamily)
MHNKIIFFDIDGTILSTKTNLILDSTREAIRKARANGHLVFVNSGRTYAEIDEVTKSIGFDGYVCGCGTYITYHGFDLLHAELPADLCQRIVKDLRNFELEAVLEGTNTIYFDYSTSYKTLIHQREIFINKYHFNVKSWEAADLSFDKFCVWHNNSEKAEHFTELYQNTFDFIGREGSFFETVPKGYSKATGIEFLLSYLNIPHENTFALGDGANDLPMLKYVKHSIGMGNSDGGVPEIVSFLTKDVDQDGVAHALQHYRII